METIPDNDENGFIRRLAEQYNVSLRFEPLGEGVRGYKIDSEIVLNEHNPPERRNWTFCHELGHIVLGHSMTPTDAEEREADQFASETMLPQRDFIPDSGDIELDKLKNLYPHASYEVLARRSLQFARGVVTIFDGEHLTARMGSDDINFPPAPIQEEMDAFRECCEKKADCVKTAKDLTINSYYVDQGRSVVRIFLVTHPLVDV
ncbi:MAG: ImmA/IrrE family metallo-endopeptidase [FCB group bacterium]|nr:ImmA/IrrE family metallo-endopeptidase [FCB group bacterium]